MSKLREISPLVNMTLLLLAALAEPACAADPAELAAIEESPFGGVLLCRASIAARLGERDKALDLLREALAAGTLAHLLHSDTDFESLWDDPEFQELIEPKG